MSIDHYVLKNRKIEVLPFTAYIKYARKNSRKIHYSRRIRRTYIGNILISTVFLSIDHSWVEGSKPILFETMVFSGTDDNNEDMTRCCTHREALIMHRDMVAKVKADIKRSKNGHSKSPL